MRISIFFDEIVFFQASHWLKHHFGESTSLFSGSIMAQFST